MQIKCDGDIPCPKFKRNPCCYTCGEYSECNFEDKCTITPQECGHKDFLNNTKKGRRK